MKVTADRVIETHHFARHVALSGGPIVKMRKRPFMFRVTHITISWDADQPKAQTVMVRGPQVVKKGKKYKTMKRGFSYCRRSYNNPKKLPKWLIDVVLEGAKLNADSARREQERVHTNPVAVEKEKSTVG